MYTNIADHLRQSGLISSLWLLVDQHSWEASPRRAVQDPVPQGDLSFQYWTLRESSKQDLNHIWIYLLHDLLFVACPLGRSAITCDLGKSLTELTVGVKISASASLIDCECFLADQTGKRESKSRRDACRFVNTILPKITFCVFLKTITSNFVTVSNHLEILNFQAEKTERIGGVGSTLEGNNQGYRPEVLPWFGFRLFVFFGLWWVVRITLILNCSSILTHHNNYIVSWSIFVPQRWLTYFIHVFFDSVWKILCQFRLLCVSSSCISPSPIWRR